jgi:hypothetical protein
MLTCSNHVNKSPIGSLVFTTYDHAITDKFAENIHQKHVAEAIKEELGSQAAEEEYKEKFTKNYWTIMAKRASPYKSPTQPLTFTHLAFAAAIVRVASQVGVGNYLTIWMCTHSPRFHPFCHNCRCAGKPDLSGNHRRFNCWRRHFDPKFCKLGPICTEADSNVGHVWLGGDYPPHLWHGALCLHAHSLGIRGCIERWYT